MKNTVFVTGGTGYLGRHLVKRLLDEGKHVLCLVPEKEEDPFGQRNNLSLVRGNLLDRDLLIRSIHNCSTVYHMAAYARPWARDPEIYYESNVYGARNVLDACLAAGVSRVVVTSSCSVVGPSFGTPADESTVRQVPMFNHYDISKKMMEEMVYEYVGRGLDAVIVRPPRIYGPGLICQSNPVTTLIKKYMDGKWRIIPGKGDKIGSYAYVTDIVDGHILAMKYGRTGECYILAGDNRSLIELFGEVKRYTGKGRKLIKIPVNLILFISYIQTALSRLFKFQPSLPYDWTGKIVYDWALSGKKAREHLGYSPTPLKFGVRRTIDWIMESDQKFKLK